MSKNIINESRISHLSTTIAVDTTAIRMHAHNALLETSITTQT